MSHSTIEPLGKFTKRLQPASPTHRRLSRAVFPLALAATFLPVSSAQQETPPQQTPAPVVRLHPRPQTPTPNNAPPDAAPLVTRPARPRPVNPQALSGAQVSTGALQGTTPRPHLPQTSPATTAGAQTAPPRTPHPATTTQAAALPAEHPAVPKLSTTLNRNLIVLDPAHGGQDSGSRIGDNLLEKDITLALAFRLRSLLTARGFTVVLTRDSDAATEPNNPSTPLTLDDRAGIANHARAAACLLLHATGRGTGIHLYSSELDPTPGEPAVLPWLTAQAAWVPASQQLERSLASALGRSRVSLVSSAASVRPMDSLTCPALVLELAPEGTDPHTVADAGYQDRVAQAIAGALIFWQNQVQTPPRLTATPPTARTTHHHPPAAVKKPETQP